MSPDQLAALGQELGALSRTNLPLNRGLAALAQEMRGDKIGKLCESLAQDLGNGIPLDQALAKHDPKMPAHLVALVKAGLASGRLPQCLDRLAGHARMIQQMRQGFLQTAFYPIVVGLFALGLMAFLLGFVIPRFAGIYRDFQMPMPILTQGLLALSMWPWTRWAILLAVCVAVPMAFWFFLGKSGRTKLALRLPVVGGMLREASMATWYDLVAMLLQSGMNLPESVRLASEASMDPALADTGKLLAQDLAAGGALGDGIRKRKLGSAWGAWLAEVGQAKGVLPEHLVELSETSKAQAENRGRWLRLVLPPLILLVLALVVVGGTVMLLFLPMFQLLDRLSS